MSLSLSARRVDGWILPRTPAAAVSPRLDMLATAVHHTGMTPGSIFSATFPQTGAGRVAIRASGWPAADMSALCTLVAAGGGTISACEAAHATIPSHAAYAGGLAVEAFQQAAALGEAESALGLGAVLVQRQPAAGHVPQPEQQQQAAAVLYLSVQTLAASRRFYFRFSGGLGTIASTAGAAAANRPWVRLLAAAATDPAWEAQLTQTAAGGLVAEHRAATPWRTLLAGHTRAVCAAGDAAPPQAVFPGSFNPWHAGHRQMLLVAQDELACGVACELAVVNVEKPPLDYVEIAARLPGTASESAALWLTAAATFAEKAELFPGATFVVGADTAARLAAARYYGGDHQQRDAALARLRRHACRFLVFGRMFQGRFCELDDLNLPMVLREICRAVPPGRFRVDLSSSELRRNAGEQR